MSKKNYKINRSSKRMKKRINARVNAALYSALNYKRILTASEIAYEQLRKDYITLGVFISIYATVSLIVIGLLL